MSRPVFISAERWEHLKSKVRTAERVRTTGRFAQLRATLARIDVCQSCGRSFEPVDEPGKVACPYCGSYLRWSDTLAARRDMSRVRCLIPPPMYGPVQRDPALMAQLRNLFRSQQRHRRKDE